MIFELEDKSKVYLMVIKYDSDKPCHVDQAYGIVTSILDSSFERNEYDVLPPFEHPGVYQMAIVAVDKFMKHHLIEWRYVDRATYVIETVMVGRDAQNRLIRCVKILSENMLMQLEGGENVVTSSGGEGTEAANSPEGAREGAN